MARIQVRCWQETYRGLVSDDVLDDPGFPAARERFWSVALSDPRYRDNHTAVAEENGELIGIAMSGPPLDAGVAWTRQLYVLYVVAAEHGTGVGPALLDAVVDAEEPVALWVADPNPRAQAFYRKHGFVADGAAQFDDGVREIRMVRRLPDPAPAGPRDDSDSPITAWASSALADLRALPGVWRVGVALTEGGGRRLRFTSSDRMRPDSSGTAWCWVDAYDDVPLNTVVRTGDPVVGSLDDLAARYPGFVAHQRETTTAALAALPVVSDGQAVGGVVLYFAGPQPFDAAQRERLAAAVAALGTDLRRAQHRRIRQGRTSFTVEPAPPTALVETFEVPGDPAAVSDARRVLQRTLEAWRVDEDRVDSAVLCLSELATNALMHTRGACSVRVMLDDGVLTLGVRDDGPGGDSSSELPEEVLRVHGRGLQIVGAVASRWTSEVDSVGRTVWCTFDPPG
jgi:anti-sigma regulatory factor (Ser/Thr protein kinase)/GNAT superfamily N-acetyltransferase